MYATKLRSNSCGDLSGKSVGKKVKLCGWVHTRRDHGGVIFIDLRDRYGLTQIVFDPSFSKNCHSDGDKLRREDCIQISGTVKKRKKGMENKKLKTGEVEVFVSDLKILNKSKVPPIEVDDRIVANDDVRLKYRYLDLRRPVMQNNLLMRAKAAQATREYLTKEGFAEIETPFLVKATPEGARDFIIPSRVNPGKFYALPQSPQLYKQILMVSGFDRYFQIARCMRDEDLRSDRQPEFTQIDLEMSFVDEDDIYAICEGAADSVTKSLTGKNIKLPLKRLSHKEAMDKYGIDKPDLRFGLELKDMTDLVNKSNFSVFKEVINKGGIAKCLPVDHEFGRKELDSLIDFSVKQGAKGMAWLRINKDKLEGNIAKFFDDKIQKELIKKSGIKKGYMLFIADREKLANSALAALRNKLGKDLKLYKEGEFAYCWVTDFPLFEWDEDEQKWTPAHHMFTMPKEEHWDIIEKDPGKVVAKCYDLVLNGVELGSGSVRIHRKDIQQRVMNVVGFSKEEAEEKFGFLNDAFEYGAPVHGGFAFGFDRLVAILLGLEDIREVIAFPKNKNAQCPMDGSPSNVDIKQLKESHIKLDVVEKK